MKLALTILSVALTACSPALPTGTLHIDSQPYATLQEAGWVHTSGEVALPMNGQIATINGLDFPLNELDMCVGERCTNITGNSIVIDGETLLIDGEKRGELLNANTAGRKSAVLALASYQPPGGVWATESAFETTSIGALPDGRIVQGEPCGWPSQCSSLHSVGSWTPEQVTLHGVTHRIDTLVEETPEATIVSGAPEHSVELYFPKSRPPYQSVGKLTWVAPRQLELDFYRPSDADFDSAIGRAVTVALAMELDRVSGMTEPPPPPPPRE